jgi:glycosyltransferase involved in cell wall biosynthesis
MKQLIHLIPANGIGGVEIAAQSMRGHSIAGWNAGPLFIERQSSNRLAKYGFSMLVAHLRALGHLLARPPDVLLCSLWRSVPIAVTAKLLRPKTRLVFFLHTKTTVHWVDAVLSKLAMVMADAIWADCLSSLDSRHIPVGKPTRVISFVVERLSPATPPKVAPSFVAWGRIDPAKGIDRSLQFLATLVERGVDARFTFFGPDNGDRSALLSLADTLGIGDRVAFELPFERDRIANIAARGAFFLQLSRQEGMCLAAVEAMQLGLVPIATAVGEMARYVQPGVTGLLFDPVRPDAAIEALVQLLDQPDAYAALSAGAQRYWANAPLYAEDLIAAAGELISRRH